METGKYDLSTAGSDGERRGDVYKRQRLQYLKNIQGEG